ncbi:MAG: twin-arginine translocase subunit TatC [Candidatus Omnitrophica bacterium]|nr:twin-arginine translocase subunit TatC [Candidatus Omnitrophota bacterium]
MNPNPEDLSFFAHYEELRSRLIKSIISVLVAACFFYVVIDEVFAFVIRPVGKLVFTAPGEALVARIMLTLFGGIFLAFPFILYQAWRFVAAGLKEHEAKYVRIFAPCSFFLFVIGGLFAYFIAIPISIRFLLSFSNNLVVPMITVKNYISFVGTMLLAFGIVFELPLVLMFLTKIGIATPAFLAQRRRYAIIIILAVSALITPPDFITQLIVAVPLIILYEAGIVASRLTYSK